MRRQFFSFFCTLYKLISFNLTSILSTVKLGFSIKYDEKKVCSISSVGSIFSSFPFIYFWTYVHYLHKTVFGHFLIGFASGKNFFIISQLYSLTHVHIFCLPEEYTYPWSYWMFSFTFFLISEFLPLWRGYFFLFSLVPVTESRWRAHYKVVEFQPRAEDTRTLDSVLND